MADEFPLKSSSLSSELPQEPILQTLLQQMLGGVNSAVAKLPDPQTEVMPNPVDMGRMLADKLQEMANTKTTTVRENLVLNPHIASDEGIIPRVMAEGDFTDGGIPEGDLVDEAIPVPPQERIFRKLRKGERLVALFGNLKSKRDKQGNLVIAQQAQERGQDFPTIDSGKITDPDTVARAAVSSKGADFLTQRMTDISKSEGTNRIELILGTIGELDEMMARRNGDLLKVANAQSGVNEAQAAVQMNRNQEFATGFAQRRPGAISKERAEAMAAVSSASLVADRNHKNLVESDPEFNRLKAYRDNLMRTFQVSELLEAKKEKLEAERAFITPQKIMAYKYAFDAEAEDDGKVRNAIKARSTDKKFMQILEINQETAMANLVSSDPSIRAAAFKIISKAEKAASGKTESNSEFIRQLRAVAQDPNYFVNQKDIAKMPSIKEKQTQVGIKSGKDQEEAAFALRYAATQEGLSRGFLLNRYDIVDNWQLTDPEMTKLRATLQTQSPNGQVLVDQFFDNYLPTNLSKDDFSARVQKLAQSLQVTFENAPRSFLFANQDDYRPAILARLENKVNQKKTAWIMSKLAGVHPGVGIYQNIVQPTAAFVQNQMQGK